MNQTNNYQAVREESYWEIFKAKLVYLFGSLVMEKNGSGKWQMSTGKVAWWIAFLPAVGIWIAGKGEAIKDISPNHFNTLVFLAAYNFGKKVLELNSKCNAYGADFNRKTLSLANKKIKKKLVYCDITKNKPFDKKFDWILLSEVIEHIEKESEAT